MPYKKFVEIGRVAFLADGPEKVFIYFVDRSKTQIFLPNFYFVIFESVELGFS